MVISAVNEGGFYIRPSRVGDRRILNYLLNKYYNDIEMADANGLCYARVSLDELDKWLEEATEVLDETL